MARRNKQREGKRLPSRHVVRDPVTGNVLQSYDVQHVTDKNRKDVSPASPDLLVHLMSEDLLHIQHMVYVPNTREMPDAVFFGGQFYEVVDTTLKPPQYKECFVAVGRELTEEDIQSE